MRICIYYPFAAQKNWNDTDLEGSGLPGTEAAIVNLAREFAKRHQVVVFNKTTREGMFHGVVYRNIGKFNYRQQWDVLLLVRGRLPGLAHVPVRLKLYWSIEEGYTLGKSWNQVLPYVKKVITISPFHTKKLLATTKIPESMVFETRLGINYQDYEQQLPKIKNKLLYCSVPRKGLEHLARIFPVVKSAVPDASLVITSDYRLWGRNPQTEQYIKQFCSIPSVKFMGTISRERLVYEQKTSWLHVYPCIFEELFCLSAMECQAAGTPSVCSDFGALPTTVQDSLTGRIIGSEHGKIPRGKFAEELIKLLKNPSQVERWALAARKRAFQYFTFQAIAAEWEGHFSRWLSEKN